MNKIKCELLEIERICSQRFKHRDCDRPMCCMICPQPCEEICTKLKEDTDED